jgi:uncharacterized surface protein with fasciclin (FAS1) repeats
MNYTRIWILFLLSLIFACTEPVEPADQYIEPSTALEDVLKKNEFDLFLSLIKDAQFNDDIEKLEEVTILAPSNTAIENTMVTLSMLSQEDQLKLLKRHIIPKKLALDELLMLSEVETLSTESLPLSVDDQGNLLIKEILINEGNIEIDNGFIHRLPEVIQN